MTETTSPGTQGSSTGSTTMREELSADASRLTQTATNRVQQAADGRKEQATTAAHAVSSAIDKAAGALRDDDQAPQWLTSAFEKTAKQVEQLAQTFEGKDVAQISRSVTDFARQSPVAFLAASAAAGFAAARFLRAGSEYQSHQQQPQPFSGQTGDNFGGGNDFGSTNTGGSYANAGTSGSSPSDYTSGGTGGSGWSGGTGADAVGAAAGSDLGAGGGSSSAFGSGQSAWAPASSPIDREGVIS